MNQYFVRSYVATTISHRMYYCNYGDNTFISAVKNGLVAGFQFPHSDSDGLKLL